MPSRTTACRARRGSRAACWRPHGVPEDGVGSRQRGARPRPQHTRILWWRTSHRMLSRFRPASRPAPRSSSRGGSSPSTFASGHMVARAELNNVRWVSHCRDLVQLPVAA